MVEMEMMIRLAYSQTISHANGFDIDAVLSGDSIHHENDWFQSKDGLVYQVFEQLSYMHNPMYGVVMLHSDGGVQDWMLFQIIGRQHVLIKRFKYPFYNCFGYTSVSAMAEAMVNTFEQIKLELKSSLVESVEKKVL